MTAYVITFVIMLGVFMAGCFVFKLPVGVSMMIAALCGAIQGGLGLETLRMMVEGEFGYVDTILTIGCAMIFMKVIEDSGALDALSSLIIEKFHKVPAVLLILIMLIIMFPGMITGSSSAAPVMGILMGVGMFIEVMTATGVRGLVVISCLRLPQVLWLLACAVSIPLFGAVSSYGACSVLGGTHTNEPAGHMAGIVLEENAKVEQGTIYVIPSINNSALTHNDPLEGNPQYMHFTTKTGETRTFQYGSRATNPIDQWPDPDIYTHTSGQTLSGSETRNLNRCYPGVEDGTLSEQVAYAVANMIRTLDIDMEIDLHESSPEYAVNNATVAHERAMPIASEGYLDLELNGISMSLEPSPATLHGLTHRELGDWTDTYALLMETGTRSRAVCAVIPTKI